MNEHGSSLPLWICSLPFRYRLLGLFSSFSNLSLFEPLRTNSRSIPCREWSHSHGACPCQMQGSGTADTLAYALAGRCITQAGTQPVGQRASVGSLFFSGGDAGELVPSCSSSSCWSSIIAWQNWSSLPPNLSQVLRNLSLEKASLCYLSRFVGVVVVLEIVRLESDNRRSNQC